MSKKIKKIKISRANVTTSPISEDMLSVMEKINELIEELNKRK